MIHVTIDRASERAIQITIDETQKGIGKALTSGIRAGAIHLTTVLKRDILSGQVLKRRSGNLSRSIFHKMENPTTGLVGVGKEAPYGLYLNEGTRPHFIFPRPGTKALAFVPGGVAHAIRTSGFVKARSINRTLKANTVFAKGVAHPGTAPYKFMELGLAMATAEIRRLIEAKLADAITSKGKTS